MSQYSDAQALQMRHAEEQYLREPDDMTVEEADNRPDGRQYLVWDSEIDEWRVYTLADMAKDMETAHYSGYGPVARMLALPTSGEGLPVDVTRSGVRTTTDGNDYMHTRYELRDDKGAVLGEFTTHIDGRS